MWLNKAIKNVHVPEIASATMKELRGSSLNFDVHMMTVSVVRLKSTPMLTMGKYNASRDQ